MNRDRKCWFCLALTIAGVIAASTAAYCDTKLVPTVNTLTLTADGNDQKPVKITVSDENGKGIAGATVTAVPDNKTVVNISTTPANGLTLADGVVTVNATSTSTAGDAKLTVSADLHDAARKNPSPAVVAIHTAAPPAGAGSKPTPGSEIAAPGDTAAAQIVKTLISYVLLMMLLSLAAEKATDLVKSLVARQSRRPAPTVKDASGKTYADLIAFTTPQLQDLWTIMQASARHAIKMAAKKFPAGDAPAEGLSPAPAPGAAAAAAGMAADEERRQLLAKIIQEDRLRDEAQSRWAWEWRLVAMVFGVILAVWWKLDSLVLLSPIAKQVPASASTFAGCLLSGAGASAGAAFWQDFLDRLTAWKQKAVNSTNVKP